MDISPTSALIFLPFAVPICIWVAWSDLKFMKIPNAAVLALVAVFLLIGLAALPLSDYPWRLLSLVLVLLVGFVASSLGLVGAGDAKFAAAMAPFVAPGDLRLFLLLFAAVLAAALLTHRGARALPGLRRRVADWESWHRGKEFPMGLALGPALGFYLALGATFGT